jgi:hypothetical protein
VALGLATYAAAGQLTGAFDVRDARRMLPRGKRVSADTPVQ